MKRVYKYPIHVTDYQEIALPIGAQPLTVQSQNGSPFLWALVDPDRDSEPFPLRIVGTGHDFKDSSDWRYLSTFQMYNGSLVFHVFTRWDASAEVFE